MDPTFAAGELGVITGLDLTAFDVIGYDLAAVVPVPAPAGILRLGLGLGFLGYRRRSRV